MNEQQSVMSLWRSIIEFNNLFFPAWRKRDPIYLSNALAGETGEICNAIKHLMGFGTKKVQVEIENVGIEAFDLLVYLVLLLERLGITEEQFLVLAQRKLNVLYNRMV